MELPRSIASVAVFGAWLYTAYGNPMPDLIGTVLFTLFSLGALVFGTVLVVQRNPARGAIAFAFVILSTCGLFLLLAAPFLMAATIIIYAGAIIVTFLFVLMLSQVSGPSDENDRSREPLFGALAGLRVRGACAVHHLPDSTWEQPREGGERRERAAEAVATAPGLRSSPTRSERSWPMYSRNSIRPRNI